MGGEYVEHGGTWRPFWIVAAAMGSFLVLDVVLPGRDLPLFGWGIALVAVLGIVVAACRSARQVWTVRVAGHGRDGELRVGRERVALSEVDAEHLRGIDSGVDAGAPVLGGGWSLRLADGRTVLVPTRDPAALRAALLTARGTLDA